MEDLYRKSELLASKTSTNIVRSVYDNIHWNSRLIGITGARGTGKTTLLLQRMKLNSEENDNSIYASLDDIYFLENSLLDFVEEFRQQGGKILYLDEVHWYPNWAREIKNIYDLYEDIKIIFTGSSVIDILRQEVDLSRRVVLYNLPGLSFREYLNFEGIASIEAINIETIINEHKNLSLELSKEFKPLKHFKNYLDYGYYPFYKEEPETYHVRLEQIIKLIIENDLRFIKDVDLENSRKIFKLLYILAGNVPFKPNISKLSEKIGTDRNTLIHYLHYLEKAKLTYNINAAGISISKLQKPDKIFLENTNLQKVLAKENVDQGSRRETFFLNQMISSSHNIEIPKKGDFIVNDKWIFEIGGKNKTAAQIKDIKNSYIASDDIEIGIGNKIPLWLFGFLY